NASATEGSPGVVLRVEGRRRLGHHVEAPNLLGVVEFLPLLRRDRPDEGQQYAETERGVAQRSHSDLLLLRRENRGSISLGSRRRCLQTIGRGRRRRNRRRVGPLQ